MRKRTSKNTQRIQSIRSIACLLLTTLFCAESICADTDGTRQHSKVLQLIEPDAVAIHLNFNGGEVKLFGVVPENTDGVAAILCSSEAPSDTTRSKGKGRAVLDGGEKICRKESPRLLSGCDQPTD